MRPPLFQLAGITGALAALLAPPCWARSPGSPVVAVFAVELRGLRQRPALAEVLTAYLASRLAETGRFEVVPQTRLRRALTARRKESHRTCYAQDCQIEIGQEVAANLALVTQIHRLGARCVATSRLFDLRKATSGRAATARGPCTESALVELIERLVAGLAGDGSKNHAATARSRPPSQRRETAEMLILSEPEGAHGELTSPGQRRRECRLPCFFARLPPGPYQLEVTAPGFQREQRSIQIAAQRRTLISVELKPVTSSAAATAGSTERPRRSPPRIGLGLAVVPLTAATRAQHAVPVQVNFGVVVERVEPGTITDQQGLQVGDVILEMNGTKVETAAALRRATARLSGRARWLIHRRGRTLLLDGSP